MRYLIFIAVILSGCGDFGDSQPASTQSGPIAKGKKGDRGDRGLSCSVEDSQEGAEIVCEDGTRARIDDGKDGQDGINGAPGQDGLDGSDGAQGPSGEISPIIVEDASGNVIGDLIYMDGTSFAVAMPGDLRAKVDNFGWTETMRTYFSLADCAGERRAVVLNGQFGNFWIDNLAGDGSYWTLASDNLGIFSYNSREDGDGICDNASGSITNSFVLNEGVALPFTLPFDNPPRIGGVD